MTWLLRSNKVFSLGSLDLVGQSCLFLCKKKLWQLVKEGQAIRNEQPTYRECHYLLMLQPTVQWWPRREMGRDAVVVDPRDVPAREVLWLDSDGVLVATWCGPAAGTANRHCRGPVTMILSAHHSWNNRKHLLTSQSFSYLRLLGPALWTSLTYGCFNP